MREILQLLLYKIKMKNWKKYDQNTIDRLLRQLDCIQYEKRKVSRLFYFKEFEYFTEKDWTLLEKVWIIDWVWPGYLLRIFWIKYITGLIFFSVDYRKHDVNYFIWGSEEDRKTADDGLLKYSILSIFDLLKKFSFTKSLYINIFLFIIYTGIWILYFGTMTIWIAFVILAYFAVRAFWRTSFNYIY